MKKVFSIICLFLCIVSCAPKYTVNYDIQPTAEMPPGLANKKIGILLFEDNRPAIEKTASAGSTVFCGDNSFEKPIIEMLNDLMIKHFNANMGNNGNVIGIIQKINEIDIGQQKVDYLLLGVVNHYAVSSHDEHYGIKMAGSVIAGLTAPIGLILMPFILLGECELKNEIEVVDLYFIQAHEPQILWRGNYKHTASEQLYCNEINNEKISKSYSNNTQKAIQSIYDNISLSAEIQFPQKTSINDSQKILKYIQSTGSVLNLNY